MANGLPGRPRQRRENPRRASFLEFFFDLAFIVALTRLSRVGVLPLIVVLDASPGLWGPGRPARRTDG
ncbi:hypothetical protein AB0J14_02280 [Micromonospora arborensis]|uniref:hypothetical protein n=1 Tax=Micromonospora arborensis TaxID=2116518 RepID=UPI0033D9CF6C